MSNSTLPPAPEQGCGTQPALWDDIPEGWQAARDLRDLMRASWPPTDYIGPEAMAEIRARIGGDVKGYVAVFRREVLYADLSPHALVGWQVTNVPDEIAVIDEQVGAKLRTDTLLLLERARSCADDSDAADLDEQIRDAKDRWLTPR